MGWKSRSLRYICNLVVMLIGRSCQQGGVYSDATHCSLRREGGNELFACGNVSQSVEFEKLVGSVPRACSTLDSSLERPPQRSRLRPIRERPGVEGRGCAVGQEEAVGGHTCFARRRSGLRSREFTVIQEPIVLTVAEPAEAFSSFPYARLSWCHENVTGISANRNDGLHL